MTPTSLPCGLCTCLENIPRPAQSKAELPHPCRSQQCLLLFKTAAMCLYLLPCKLQISAGVHSMVRHTMAGCQQSPLKHLRLLISMRLPKQKNRSHVDNQPVHSQACCSTKASQLDFVKLETFRKGVTKWVKEIRSLTMLTNFVNLNTRHGSLEARESKFPHKSAVSRFAIFPRNLLQPHWGF